MTGASGSAAGRAEQIRMILDKMEGRPPNEAVRFLKDLASLCLCTDVHQSQVNDVAGKWDTVIGEVTRVYDRELTLRGDIRSQEGAVCEEEAKNQDLQVEVEESRTRVPNLSTTTIVDPEIERLQAGLAINAIGSQPRYPTSDSQRRLEFLGVHLTGES